MVRPTLLVAGVAWALSLRADPPAAEPGEVLPPVFNLVVKHPVPPPPARPSLLSRTMRANVATLMPKFDPAAASKPALAPGNSATDPSVLRMAAFHVRDKAIAFEESQLYSKDALTEIAMKRYLSPLDYAFLGRFYIPLFGGSREDRAMAAYEEGEMKRRNDMITELEQLDRAK